MKDLLKTACAKSHYISLFVFTMIASLLCTFAGQLEMFSLGVITKKGPDFFELFGPIENNTIIPANQVSKEQLLERFEQLDIKRDNVVTKEDADTFITAHKNGGLIQNVLNRIHFPIEDNVSYLIIALIMVAIFKALTLFAWKFGTRVLAIIISKDLRQSYF